MSHLCRLRSYLHRAVRVRLQRPSANNLSSVSEQQCLQKLNKSAECRVDKNAILYDAFLQDSPFFEPRYRCTRTNPNRQRLRCFLFDSPITYREYGRLNSKFAGARNEKRGRVRSLFDRLLLPTDFWSLAAIWAGGLQLGTLLYVQSELREQRQRMKEVANGAERVSQPPSELRSLMSRLCVWPICSTVNCMRDGNSTASWIRGAHSTEPWSQAQYSAHADVDTGGATQLRRTATSPELSTAPFTFRFEQAARTFLVDIEDKFRRNRDAFFRQTSASQYSLAEARSQLQNEPTTVGNEVEWRPLNDDCALSRSMEQLMLSPPPSPPMLDASRVDVAMPAFRSASPRLDLPSYSERLEDSDCEAENVSEYGSASRHESDCESEVESDSDTLSVVSDESDTRVALFRTSADFKPLDPVDIQLGALLDSLNRDAARRELARALEAAGRLVNSRSAVVEPDSKAVGVKEPWKRALADASVRQSCEMAEGVSFSEVRSAFSQAAQHAEQAGDEAMRSRILYNEAVFLELAYRNGVSAASRSRTAVPEALQDAKRCYLEALEADRRNVRAAANLAALCMVIRNQVNDAAIRRAYERRARKYAQLAAQLGDVNALSLLDMLDESDLESDNESEQCVPVVRGRKNRRFDLDDDRFAFG